MFDRLISSGMCTYEQLMDNKFDWTNIWEMQDMLDLRDYIDWESHVVAAERSKHGGS
jgi:hypothetical protein